MLSEAKSEVLKQECRAERADCAVRELQRQTQPNRMEIGHTNLGYETSRKGGKPGLVKKWRNEKEHFEKLIWEVFMKWKN